MNVGIIGTGNMATSLIRGFLAQGIHKVICSDVDTKRLKPLRALKNVRTTTENISVVENSEIIFLCVKPDAISEVLKETKKKLNSRKILVSIAAGVKTSFIQKLIGPKKKVIRTMPNLSCLILRGVIGFKANRHCTNKDRKAFLSLIETTGKAFELKAEKDFDYITAISGSGPAFLAEYIAAQLAYGKSKNLGEVMVKDIVFETILGAVAYLNTTKVSPEKFVKLVSSPGGTTEAGIKLLKNKRFTNIIVQCLDSASKKSVKISDKLIMNKN